MAKIGFKAPKNKIIPAGAVAQLRIFEFEVKDSKSSEFQYINWTMIVEGATLEDGSDTDEYNDMRIWHITSLNPKATFALKALIEAADAPYNEVEGENGPEIEFDTDDVIGKLVTARIGTKEYQGKESNTIEKFVAAFDAE